MSEDIDIVVRIKDSASGPAKGITGSLKDLDDQAQGTASRGLSGLQNAVGVGLKAAVAIGTAAIIGLGTVIGSGIGKAADMEQGVANIAANMSLASDETSKLKGYITDLGLDPGLVVDATGAAEAIGTLGTAGLDLTQIMDGAAKSTILMSNATGGSMSDSASLLTDIMGQFNITAGDSGEILDQITGLTVATKWGFNDVAGAFAQVGGAAGALGMTFQDTAAMLAITSTNFASGSDQATAMKTYLQRLVPTTKEATQAMIDLGLANADGTSKFFDASGAMISAEEQAALMQQALGGLSDAQRNSAVSTIFGADAMRFALGVMEGGKSAIVGAKAEIGNTSAEEMAAKRMDTLSGAWAIFTGVVDTLQMAIGDKFLPIARNLVEWATGLAQVYGPMVIDWFGKLADSLGLSIGWLLKTAETGTIFNEAFTALPTPIQGVITTIASLIDKVQSVTKPIVDSISQFISWKDVLAAVGVVIATMLYPAITAFLGVVAPAVAVFAGLVAASALLRAAWENDWQGIVDVVTTLLPQFWAKLEEWGTAAWQWIQDAMPVVRSTLGEWATSIFGWLGDNLPYFLKTILEWGTALYTWIGDAIPKAIDGLTNFIKGIREQGDGDGKSSLGGMADGWATTLWQWIKNDLIPKVGPAFSDFIRAMMNYGGKLLVSLGNLAKELGLLLWEWIVDVTPVALRKIGEWGGALWGWIKENWPVWRENLGKWAKAAWEWIVDITPMVLAELGVWGRALWDWVEENEPIWRANLELWGAAAWKWITETAIPEALKKLGEWGTMLVDWVKENAPIWAEQFKVTGLKVIQWLWDGIEIMWIRLTDWFFSDTAFGGFVGDILAMLGVQLGPAYGVMYENGKKITYSLNDGSRYGLDSLRQTGSDMGSAISGGLQKNMDMHSPSRVMWGFGEDIMAGLQGGVRTGITGLKSEMQFVADTIKATMQQANNEMLAGIEYFTNQALIKAQAAHYKIANAAQDAGAILKQLGIDVSNSVGLGPNGELILKGIANLPKVTNSTTNGTGTGDNFVPETKEITTIGQALGTDKINVQGQGTSLDLLGGITLQTADLNALKEDAKAATEQSTKTAQDFIGGFVDFLKGTLEGAGSVFSFFKAKEETAYREGNLQEYIGSETAQTKTELKGLYQGIQNSIADLLGVSSSDLSVTSGDSLRLIDRVKQVLAGTTIDSNMEFVGGLLQDLVNFRTLSNAGTGNGYFDGALPTDARLTGGNTTNTYNINLMGTSNASADIMSTVQLLNQLQVTAP